MTSTGILLESGTNELEIVEFYLDETREDGSGYRGYFGINVAKVLEIIRQPELTDMPDTSHPAVLGAFNLRDEIIPLIDLAKWLGKKRSDSDVLKVIVTEFNRTKSAFLVSGVTRIHRINWKQVEAPTKYVSSLTVNSITGVVRFGSRIVFILDMEKICVDLNPALEPTETAPEALTTEVSNRHVKVVVADDSSMARRMIAHILEKAGYTVHSVENGEQAWSYLQAQSRKCLEFGDALSDHVDAVVSDIEMPVMDGHTLTRRIKEDAMLRNLPVVLCSSIITDTLHHKGISVGADAQISKAELNELAETVFRLVKDTEQLRDEPHR
ncbi:chemotaxis protein [Pseudodesulfovibrio tunisiensis]|uniref:chemotaxis protein n=1 Tax=Pseudodesulfovibrio tunisiensis TaxID=463192 RepID=UPI001FB287F0|nr:chemotaxis protein [Pseudodesulfovibrio tunisiensis]